MASNIYAKSYRIESRAPKNDEYAFISYLDDPHTFSVVGVKRLLDVDQFGKGSIREKNKLYRISVERTGTKVAMEDLAMEAEQSCSYYMNTEVVSDTEEWHRRKRSSTSKNREQSSVVDKPLNDLCSFDDDEDPTYTTLMPCRLNEVHVPGADINGHASSSSDDDEDENDLQANTNQRKTMSKNARSSNAVIGLNLKPTSTRKKRSSTTGREASATGVLVDNNSSSISLGNHSNVVQPSPFMDDLSSSITQMRKQIFALSQTVEQQNKVHAEILRNQKKMTKAMRENQIPILLECETSTLGSSTDANMTPVTVKQLNGDELDLVQLPSDRTRPNKYVLSCVSKLFKDEEIINTSAPDLATDSRVLLIRKAVQTKFGLNAEQTETIWTSMLRSIKSRRRNTSAKVRRNDKKQNANDANSNKDNNDNDPNNSSLHQDP